MRSPKASYAISAWQNSGRLNACPTFPQTGDPALVAQALSPAFRRRRLLPRAPIPQWCGVRPKAFYTISAWQNSGRLNACPTFPQNWCDPALVAQALSPAFSDAGDFCHALLYLDGVPYEGTGLKERSSIRKVKPETGEVPQKRELRGQYFGEGIIVWKDRLIELTYQTEKGFVYDLATFSPKSEFTYPGEGWGLTTDGKRIIMSDGTPQIRFWDPETLKETGRIMVNEAGKPVTYVNELEWVKGEIYANVWKTERVARIDPQTGNVLSWIDLHGLLTPQDYTERTDALNGIAYDAKNDRLFVTGKCWPKLFEIKLVKNP
jgi:glutaminyl-peptide cyclotransferase